MSREGQGAGLEDGHKQRAFLHNELSKGAGLKKQPRVRNRLAVLPEMSFETVSPPPIALLWSLRTKPFCHMHTGLVHTAHNIADDCHDQQETKKRRRKCLLYMHLHFRTQVNHVADWGHD
jgi:hypothetical protein